MDNYYAESTHSTPEISLDARQGLLEFNGRSIPENAMRVYRPVMEWLDAYLAAPRPATRVDMRLSFFNTSTSKYILDMLKRLETLALQGFGVDVNWYYDDEDMRDLGTDYQALVRVPMRFIDESRR